jgi:glutamate-1-semialdehyde 2,1-aminomutase
MRFERCNDQDLALITKRIADFLPQQIFDAHAHLFNAQHFVFENLYPMLKPEKLLGIEEYRNAAGEWLPKSSVEGLFFGFPNRGNDRVAINRWMAAEIKKCGGKNSRVLALTSPKDKPDSVAAQISELGLVGVKPYHVYARDGDTGPADIEEFAPEWMWELCHSIRGVLMLHMVKYRAIADPKNQADIRRLCRKYPKCRLVLAHVARSFNYRHAREGLHTMADLDNVWVDMSAVTETEAIRCAIKVLGTKRVLYGSDYPVTQLRGRCVALGDSFFWIYPTTANLDTTIPKTAGALVGVESLLCLREACEDAELSKSDIKDIFRNNALRLLEPHLKKTARV